MHNQPPPKKKYAADTTQGDRRSAALNFTYFGEIFILLKVKKARAT